MLPDEARWIGARLAELELGPEATVVDAGSKGEDYRSLVQPYIDHDVFRPLRERNVEIVHVDSEAQPGVDVVVDLTSLESLPSELRAAADVVICASVLAHVSDRDAAIASLAAIAKPGALAIVAAPHRYPLTSDPLDSGYRPTPDELASDLAPSFESTRRELVASPPNNLLVRDGPAHTLAYWALRQIAARVIRRRRVPRECLVSAVVARRAPG